MNSITGIPNSNASLDNTSASGNSNTVDIDGFYQLFAAQLQYQDPDSPMDTSEMVSMLTQTQMIEAMMAMTTAISQMTQTNSITYATSMMGKTVTMAEYDDKTGTYTGEETTGVVTGVLMGEQPILYVDGKPYLLAQIMTVGSIDESTNEDNSEGDVVETEVTHVDGE